MSKKLQNNIEFNIARINTDEFAILKPPHPGKGNEMRSEFRFGVDNEQRLIAVISKFTFTQEQHTFLLLTVSCHYQLKEDSWLSWKEGQKLTIPQNFLRHLSTISIGCARGILHCKTEGTTCSGLILPTVNLFKAIKKDLIVDL